MNKSPQNITDHPFNKLKTKAQDTTSLLHWHLSIQTANMENNENRGFEDDGVDLFQSHIDGADTVTTPGTEFSPPESPLPKKAALKNSRIAARDKLKSLSIEEKVWHPRDPLYKYHVMLTTSGVPTDGSRLLANKVDSHQGDPSYQNERWP